jgi:hypothetical protein
MPLLDPPHCPNCNSEIDLKALWRAAPKGRGLFLSQPVGLACPACGAKLRVLQGWVQVSLLLTYLVPVVAAVFVGRVIPLDANSVRSQLSLVGLAIIWLAGFVLQQHNVPKLLRLRFLNEGETVRYPLVDRAKRDAALRAAIEEDERSQPAPAEDGPAWTCKACGEENPGTFNECWKCMKLRPEAGASSSS